MKLRYSCSSMSCTFVRFVVPELARAGISEMELPWGGTLRFCNLSVIELKADLPLQRHIINLSTIVSEEVAESLRINNIGAIGAAKITEIERKLEREMERDPMFVNKGKGEFWRSEVIEAGNLLSHNLLRCSESGAIIDFSLGQFTGTMIPGVYKNQEDFTRLLPTDKLHIVYDSPQREIEQQIANDMGLSAKSPDYSPPMFAKRVVRGCMRAISSGVAAFCANCYAEEVPLLKCSQCLCVSYCSRSCQKLHWKSHKQLCKVNAIV